MTIKGFEFLHWTQHFRIIGGVIYRDAVARRLSDGSLRLVAVRDES
jgi:hypothetical protein